MECDWRVTFKVTWILAVALRYRSQIQNVSVRLDGNTADSEDWATFPCKTRVPVLHQTPLTSL